MFKAPLLVIFKLVSTFCIAGIMIFITGIVLLIILIIININKKKRQHFRRVLIRKLVESLIQKAIFSTEEEYDYTDELYYRAEILIADSNYREIFKEAILSARKNLSGISSDGIRQLYLHLGLAEYALQMLNDPRWYVKAAAIQELAIMGIDEHIDKILHFADDENEIVRIEAQTALVKLQDYKGLVFLDKVTYPITDWQQIKLLKELSYLPEIINFSGIEKWFNSPNYSVIVFAIRIAGNYNLFHLYDHMISSLYHINPKVRLEAINTLKEVYTGETAAVLKSLFENEVLKNQIAIARTLQKIGSDDDVAFLLDHLNCENNELKLSLLRAIACISKHKMVTLDSLASNAGYPLVEMIAQIKEETT
jgi:HEAT repeat protein